MDENQNELDHLHGCEISFPPEIFLYAGTTGREEVVEVHHTVHPGVEEGPEPTVASSDKPGAPPAEPGQGAVVDDVEGREVGELLTGNKEDGVCQVNKLKYRTILVTTGCCNYTNQQRWLAGLLPWRRNTTRRG